VKKDSNVSPGIATILGKNKAPSFCRPKPTRRGFGIVYSNFEFVSDFGFRIFAEALGSDFG
jgi:hypothetical protein